MSAPAVSTLALAPHPSTPDAQLRLTRLAVRGFRNLERLDLEPARRLTVISGNNGQGKTSLLEAIYFLCTSRSFRTHRLAELIRHGDAAASVRGSFISDRDVASPSPLVRQQHAAVERGRAIVDIDGDRPPSLVAYATRSPVVVFHPDELTLTTGPAASRRRLLDRIALFLEPASLAHKTRYVRALRSRHDLLRHPRPGSTAELEVFEALCAEHGAALTRARARATEALQSHLAAAFRSIAAPDLSLTARYAPGGDADPDVMARRYAEDRPRDAHRPTASAGPHRDEIDLVLDGHAARVVASQGQHRALTLALKTAEASCIAAASGQGPILLLDDVSSELDPERTSALLGFLAGRNSQIFLTTTRPEIILPDPSPGADRRDVRIVRGRLETAP